MGDFLVTIAFWLAVIGLAVALLVYGFGQLRLRFWQETGRGACRYCGTRLTVLLNRWQFPVGFFPTCRACGRDQ